MPHLEFQQQGLWSDHYGHIQNTKKMRTLTNHIPFKAYLNPYATRYLETYVVELVKMILSANAEHTT